MLPTNLLATLKTAIAAETDPTFVADRTAGNTGNMAAFYNVSSTFIVWRSTTPNAVVANAINWKNFTPSDPADVTAIFTNRALLCQGFQFNIQNLFLAAPGGSMATGQQNVRQGLNDSLSAVPSGVGGATQSAGWAAVKTVISRPATRGEKLFATGTGTSGSPGDLGWEGQVQNEDIIAALGA